MWEKQTQHGVVVQTVKQLKMVNAIFWDSLLPVERSTKVHIIADTNAMGEDTVMYEICDMHAHFLPGVDDGCKTAEEALQVLKCSYEQGICRMFATPHYYPVETVETFLQRRQEAARLLQQAMDGQEQALPQILLGAEVAYHPGLGYEENLERLCMGSSRYLLLEMPFSKWGSDVVRTVRNICVRGFTPIIAHIERYLDMQSTDTIWQLLEQDVLIQMNAGQLLRFPSGRRARKWLEKGMVHLLGSDCHNMTTRVPNLGQAVKTLEKHKMGQVIENVTQLSAQIFSDAAQR